MRFTPNFSRSTGKRFDPIRPGTYEAEIVGGKPEISLNNKPFLNVEFVILGPTEKGRHVWAKLFMTEASVWKLAALFNAIGEPLTDEADTESLLGKQVLIVVDRVQGEDGVLRNEVVTFRKPKIHEETK
jgi:hypothetical protein